MVHGSSIYIHETLSSQSLMHKMTSNNAYNICAVLVCNNAKQFLLFCIYRVPWAASADDKELCAMIESVAFRHMKLIVMGDFYLPCYHPQVCTDSENCISCFFNEYSLCQLVKQLSREESFLDLILVSPHFVDSCITYLPPIDGSDHTAQLLTLENDHPAVTNKRLQASVDVDLLGVLLSQTVWDSVFARCLSVDDFVGQFDIVLQDAISRSIKTIYYLRRNMLFHYYEPRSELGGIARKLVTTKNTKH